MGKGSSADCAYENINASRHAIELRHPYRDPRLIEFVLGLPAFQLYRHGYSKYILRVAMQGILPEIIRARIFPTPLLSLFSRGLEREDTIYQSCLQDTYASWRKFVRSDWLLSQRNNQSLPIKDGPELYMIWLCIAYEAWNQYFISIYNKNI